MKFIHYLGPRYTSRFQSESLGNFYTYEASTACNIVLTEQATKNAGRTIDLARFAKLLKEGTDIHETSFLASITPTSGLRMNEDVGVTATMQGDIVEVTDHCMDWAMWKIGGAAIPLRFVQLASVSEPYPCVFRALDDNFMIDSP